MSKPEDNPPPGDGQPQMPTFLSPPEHVNDALDLLLEHVTGDDEREAVGILLFEIGRMRALLEWNGIHPDSIIEWDWPKD